MQYMWWINIYFFLITLALSVKNIQLLPTNASLCLEVNCWLYDYPSNCRGLTLAHVILLSSDLGTSTCILRQTLLQRSIMACLFVFLPLEFSLLCEGLSPLALGLCEYSGLPHSGSMTCSVPSSSVRTPNECHGEREAQSSSLPALSTLFSSAPPSPEVAIKNASSDYIASQCPGNPQDNWQRADIREHSLCHPAHWWLSLSIKIIW